MVNLVEGFIKSIPWGIRKELDRLLRAHYAKEGYMVIPKFDGFVCIGTDLKYEFCSQIGTLGSVQNEYVFSDILKTDVVVDIGANIGGFSLPAARMGQVVYAVEPLYANILERNIALNNINNIRVVEVGISDRVENCVIRFGERKKRMRCVPLSEILDQSDGCDFLKSDCEGGELSFTIDDLKRVRRRVEGELHLFNGNKKRIERDFFKMFDAAGFNIDVERTSERLRLFHAYRRKA